MIKDYPLSGVGVGGFIIEVSNYAETHNLSIPNFQSSENYVLQVTSELGLYGLFLIFWVFWEILKQMRKNYLRFSGSDKNVFLYIGAVGGIVSYLINIQAHTYIGSYEIKYTFWLMTALIFLLNKNDDKEEK
jgi:O-antigen ligase